MTMTSAVERERRKIQQLAREYRKKGYEVTVTPKPADLPRALQGFTPDLVARKPGDNLVIEVKTLRTATSGQLSKLAGVVENLPDWRFELVMTNPRNPLGVEPSARLLNKAEVHARFLTARRLLQDEMVEPAALIAWSAIEGITRLIADHEGMNVEAKGPSFVLKQLFSRGLLAKTAYTVFEKGLEMRNAIVHGYSLPRLGSQEVLKLITHGEALQP